MLMLVQRSQHLIFALLWWWWGLDSEDILEFYGLNAETRQWQATIIPWLTPCMTNSVKFQNILVICEVKSLLPAQLCSSKENQSQEWLLQEHPPKWWPSEENPGSEGGSKGWSRRCIKHRLKLGLSSTVTEQNSSAPEHWSRSFLGILSAFLFQYVLRITRDFLEQKWDKRLQTEKSGLRLGCWALRVHQGLFIALGVIRL